MSTYSFKHNRITTQPFFSLFLKCSFVDSVLSTESSSFVHCVCESSLRETKRCQGETGTEPVQSASKSPRTFLWKRAKKADCFAVKHETALHCTSASLSTCPSSCSRQAEPQINKSFMWGGGTNVTEWTAKSAKTASFNFSHVM